MSNVSFFLPVTKATTIAGIGPFPYPFFSSTNFLIKWIERFIKSGIVKCSSKRHCENRSDATPQRNRRNRERAMERLVSKNKSGGSTRLFLLHIFASPYDTRPTLYIQDYVLSESYKEQYYRK